MNLIDVSGLGHSGKSSVNGFLSEFDNLDVHPPGYELNICRLTAGLFDLHETSIRVDDVQYFDRMFKLNKTLFSNLLPEVPFITKSKESALEYLHTLLVERTDNLPWYDVLYSDGHLSFRQKLKKTPIGSYLIQFKRAILKNHPFPTNHVYFPRINPKEDWIELFLQFIFNSDNLVCNNLFGPSISNNKLDLIPSCKSIFVLRDPRDIIASIGHRNRYIPDFERKNDIQQQDLKKSFVSKTDLSYFVDQQKRFRDRVSELNPERCLVIWFEDICLNYQSTTQRIMDFLILDPMNHKAPRIYFDPSKSKKNIGLYKSYIDQTSIRFIEMQMRDYLYE